MAITIATGLSRSLRDYEATSTTSLTTVPGSKSLTITTGKAFSVGDTITLTMTGASKIAPRLRGSVTSYNPAQDAFYTTFTGGVLSGLITARG